MNAARFSGGDQSTLRHCWILGDLSSDGCLLGGGGLCLRIKEGPENEVDCRGCVCVTPSNFGRSFVTQGNLFVASFMQEGGVSILTRARPGV